MARNSASLGSAWLDPSDEKVTLKPGFAVPASIRITSLNLNRPELEGFTFDVTLKYLKNQFRYGIEYLGLLKSSGDIQALDVRAIPFRELMHWVRQFGLPNNLDTDFLVENAEHVQQLKRGDRGELLKRVGFYAAVARLTSGDPNRAISETFSTSERTSSRWISDALKLGYLD